MLLGLRLLHGSVPLATALAVLLVSPEVFAPLRRAGAEFHASAEGQAAGRRILDLLDQPPVAPARPAVTGTATWRAPAPLVEVHRARVRYPGRREVALEAFDLVVEPGEHVALCGPSGSGKSTVLALLLGFVAPESGAVRLGGSPLEAVDLARWRQRLTWVPQRPHLFSATLGENLAMARPGASAAEMLEALEVAGLADFVRQLPRGLDTPVGDGGLTLSAGERQRVALARATLRDAPLVLLDEPAAHLDLVTEEELRDRLDPWWADRGVVVAAHRVELMGRIDRVVTMTPPAPGTTAPDPPGDPVEAVR
jgi:ATP-binding cassette subfamily C protein CydCD